MNLFSSDPEPSEDPQEAGEYQLVPTNLIVDFSEEFKIQQCTFEVLKEAFADMSLRLDKIFEDMLARNQGVYIDVEQYLWMPKWEMGRLTLLFHEVSLEGREFISNSIEDPVWKDSLLWSDSEQQEKRRKTIKELHSTMNLLITEGLELFELVTRQDSDGSAKQQVLTVPISETNRLDLVMKLNEERTVTLKGPFGSAHDIECRFQVKLYNDVYRKRIGLFDIAEMIDEDQLDSDDEDEGLM